MTPITPNGTRTLRMRSPLDFVHSASVSPTGSGRAATSRTPRAISWIRDGVRSKRSRMASARPELSISSRFASKIAFSLASRAAAIDNSSVFFSLVESRASLAAAARARRSFCSVALGLAEGAGIRVNPPFVAESFAVESRFRSYGTSRELSLADGVHSRWPR